MYEFVDRPVTELDHGGRFLIWSMRSWATAIDGKACPASRLAPPFAHWCMLSGFQPFLRMMDLLNRYGLATLKLGGLRCNHISEHEAIILSLLRSLHDGRPERLHATLVLLVDEDGIGGLIEAISQLERAMAAAGIGGHHTPSRHLGPS